MFPATLNTHLARTPGYRGTLAALRPLLLRMQIRLSAPGGRAVPRHRLGSFDLARSRLAQMWIERAPESRARPALRR
jgi:hypothetical protein